MKNRLLPLLFVLGSYSAYSQVGIGTLSPSTSSQLEVFASDRGVLIPRVTLTSSADTTTITNSNVESLLVFNTASVSDIKPGYYYWYEGKWNRIAISSEVTGGSGGVIGGNGVPGNRGEAGYPGKDISIYTDQVSGIVYVQNIDGTWTTLNGKNGLDGKNGIAGGNGLPGEAGLDGTIQMYIDESTGIIYVRDPQDKDTWIPLSVKNGIDGVDGKPGTAGVSVPSGSTIVIDKTTGTIYVLTPGANPDDPASWTSINGKNGLDGKNGISGGIGLPGDAGLDGTIEMYIDQSTGIIYVRDPENKDKWVPLSANNGIDGINGKPGTDGVSVPSGSTIVIDKTTGTIYVLTPGANPDDPASWTSINGKNGLDGKNGISGGIGLPGDAGLDGTIEMYIDQSTGIIYVRDPENKDKWVPLSANNGIDGINGKPGTDGVSVPSGSTIVIDKTTGTIYVLTPGANPDDPASWTSINGKNGLDGKNGLSGGIGVPGAEGTAGIDGTIQMYIDQSTGIVYVRDPKDATKWVPLTGERGIDGIKGIDGEPGKAGTITTLDAIVKDANGNIYAYVGADGTVAGRDKEWAEKSPNWVKINGLNGAEGIPGADGEPGTPGSITTLDAIVKSPNGDIYAYVGTEKTVEGRDKEWVEKSPNWVKISGRDGVDGAPGLAGGPGAPGDEGVTIPAGTTTWINTTDGVIYVKDAAGEWIAVSGKVAPNNILGIQVISDNYTVTVDDYTVIAEDLTKDITITLPDPTLSKGRILVINQFDMVKADGTPIVVNFNHEIRYSSKARYTYMAGSLFGGATAGSMKVTLQSNGVNWYVITYTM